MLENNFRVHNELQKDMGVSTVENWRSKENFLESQMPSKITTIPFLSSHCCLIIILWSFKYSIIYNAFLTFLILWLLK